MAQLDHLILTEGKFDDTRHSMEESTTPVECSTFFTAKQELNSTSTEDSLGCASSSDHAHSCSDQYFSNGIHSIMESRGEFGSNSEAEIEASKEHWSELHGDDEEYSAEKNLEVFRSLQKQYGPEGFFKDWNPNRWAVGEKIAEGAQGEVFTMKWFCPGHAFLNDRFVLKVFKQGYRLQDLQKQWPQAMLLNPQKHKIAAGLMLEDGRYAIWMNRLWGDLRKVIDARMEHNGNHAPPFTEHTALLIMFEIAYGMEKLHEDGIVHRDLKASNVLISPHVWWKDGEKHPQRDFDPISDDNFTVHVADYDSSIGVVGTRFWRAPEVLLGVKSCDIHPNLFTEKSDVYSYAMTCYEILTGEIPFKDLRPTDYDSILQGARPMLPKGTHPWIQSLLSRCWHCVPSTRPSFQQIQDFFIHGIEE